MITIRHDDYDFRLTPQQYKDIHAEFEKRGLIETIAIQPTQWGRLASPDEDFLDYLKEHIEKGCMELAVHGWGHFHYDEMEYDFILRDLFAVRGWCRTYLDQPSPKVWYTPWNCMSNNIERAAKAIGIEVSNESNDIAKFLRQVKINDFHDKTLYFHGWSAYEMGMFIEMLDWVVKENDRRKNNS